jgi:DNA-binding MarR family transcriptional regulator
LSVGELAAMTGVSQPAISQIRKRLEAENLVIARVSASDQRRHELALTALGRRLADEAAPIWSAVAAVSAELCRIAAPNLLAELDALERQLDAATMQSRVAAILDKSAQIKPATKGRKRQ